MAAAGGLFMLLSDPLESDSGSSNRDGSFAVCMHRSFAVSSPTNILCVQLDAEYLLQPIFATDAEGILRNSNCAFNEARVRPPAVAFCIGCANL